MGLKRKRSFPETSPASSTSSLATNSTRLSQSPSPLAHHVSTFTMDLDQPIHSLPFTQWGAQTRKARVSASDLGCRTRKRHRDNRPDQQIVHESTINKLFEAQKYHPDAAPIISQPQTRLSNAAQKSNLHAFWSIPKHAPRALTTQHPPGFEQAQRQNCEDCDKLLRTGEAMDMDIMDMDTESVFACRSCARNVCDTCSVLGDMRCCLGCATSVMQR